MVNAEYHDIHESLVKMDFSRDANVEQLVVDWPRLRKSIRIDGVSFEKFLTTKGVELPADNQIVSEAINEFLRPLIPESQRVSNVKTQHDKLAALLHQGGLPSLLENKIVTSLSVRNPENGAPNGRMLDDTRAGMIRWMNLVTTNTGFKVISTFSYRGNISPKDPDNPEFIQDPDAEPMLTGHSEFSVSVTKDAVTPRFLLMQVKSSNPRINKQFGVAIEEAQTADGDITITEQAEQTIKMMASFKDSILNIRERYTEEPKVKDKDKDADVSPQVRR